MNEKLLEVKNLHTSFTTDAGTVQAVRGVSFYVDKGESLGIVGESGCGKSVSMLSVMRLLDDNASMTADAIILDGENLADKPVREMRKIQGNDIGMIFQDPMTSLNPLFTVGEQIRNPLMRHMKLSKKAANERALKMLELVGIPSPAKRLKQYPHELSGGMRQRVMIAIAMCCDPKLLIADEPTTALDVTIQAQILELLKELKDKIHMGIVFITHDLGVISSLCSRVIVMYGGLIMEEGTVDDIFYRTGHPYSAGLLASIPKQNREKLVPIVGTPPDLLNPPQGCPFAARCSHAMRLCKACRPELTEIGPGHKSACWLHNRSVKAQKGEVKLI